MGLWPGGKWTYTVTLLPTDNLATEFIINFFQFIWATVEITLFPLCILACVAERDFKGQEQREIGYLDMRMENKPLIAFNTQMTTYLWKYVAAAGHQNKDF